MKQAAIILAFLCWAGYAQAQVGDVNNPQTNASALTAGTLPAGRMPALTGDCTTSAGAVATTCTKTGGTAFATSATVNPEIFCSGSTSAASGNLGSIAVCKTVNAVTVDNIVAITGVPGTPGSLQFLVSDCGTTANNCASPTAVGSVTTSNTSNTAVDGTISNASIAAGHYIQIRPGTGTCTTCDYSVTVAMH